MEQRELMAMEAKRGAALLLVLALAVPVLPAGAQAVDHVLITAVYYDTYVVNEGDEFVRLTNPTSSAVDLSGWKLTDGEGTVTFPGGASIAAGASIFITAKATDFRIGMLVDPQWEFLSDTDPGVPQMSRTGTFALSNSGDEVRLLKADSTVVDTVIFGSSPGSEGWTGAALEDVGEGTILERDLDELTSEYVDTDTAADWDDARIWVVGQSRFSLQSFTATRATMFSSPDSSYEEVERFLNAATSTLDIELYELTNVYIGEVIASRAEAGVAVRLLMEGGPVGFNETERFQQNWILDRIQEAGADVRFMVTNSSQSVHDRYAFLHGKFGVADGARVLAMSGNWKYTGLPVDPTYGNREWGIVVDSGGLAGYITTVFEHDWDDRNGDILRFGEGTDWRYLPPPPDFEPDRNIPTGPYAPYFPSESVDHSFTVTPVISPDTSLLEHSSLRKLIREAKTEVLIEQMYAHKHWGPSQTGTPETHPNHYLEAAITAARNGAGVRVILGEEFIDDEDTRNNRETVDYINGIAQNESLNMSARLVNSKIAEILKIHNKGVVVDRQTAVVSSINWGRNSAQGNRELALLAEDKAVAEFYRDIFWYDWAPRSFKPITDLTVRDIQVRPANLVTEVLDKLPSLPPPLPVGVPGPPVPVPAMPPTPPPPVPVPTLPVSPSKALGPLLPPVDHPQSHVVQVTIGNVGRYGAGDFNVTLDLVPTGSGEAEQKKVMVNSLPRGKNLTLNFTWDTFMKLGTFNLTAVVDSDNDVRETNEKNNTLDASYSIVVPMPGTVLPRPAPPAAPAPPVPLPGLPKL